MSVALSLADGRRRCGSAAEDAHRALAARCGPLVRLYAPRLRTRAGVAVIAGLSLLALTAALSQGLVARMLQEAPGSLAWNETVRRAGAPRGLSVDATARRAPYAADHPPLRDPRIFVLGPCSASAPSAAPELLECDARLVRSILWRWDDDERRRERADKPNSKSRGLEQNVALYELIERSGWRTTSIEEADVIVVDVLPILSHRASLGQMFEREFSTYTGTEHLERMRQVNDFLVENAPCGVPILFLCPSMACGRGRFTRQRKKLPKGDPRRASPNKLIDVPTSDPKGRYMREEPMLAEMRDTIRDAGVRVAIPECDWIGIENLPPEACLAMPYTRHSGIKRRLVDLRAKSRERLLFTFIGSPRGQATREAFQRIADEEGVYLGFSAERLFLDVDYPDVMSRSVFCFVPRGDSPTSRRMYDAMAAACVPVIVSDDWSGDMLPFHELIPWEMFVVRVTERDWKENPRATLERLREMPARELAERQRMVRQFAQYVDAHDGDGVLRALLHQLRLLPIDRVEGPGRAPLASSPELFVSKTV